MSIPVLKILSESELGNIIGIFHKCMLYKGLQNICITYIM